MRFWLGADLDACELESIQMDHPRCSRFYIRGYLLSFWDEFCGRKVSRSFNETGEMVRASFTGAIWSIIHFDRDRTVEDGVFPLNP